MRTASSVNDATGPAAESYRLLPVRFDGPGSGEGELTWAQAEHWQIIAESGRGPTIGGAFELPPGRTVGDVAELLRFSLSRHQSLRTRIREDPSGRPQQVCDGSGTADLRVVEAGRRDPAMVAAEVLRDFTEQPFDYAHEWPVRMAAVTRDGLVSHVVTVYLHLAIDAGGISALMADLNARDPVTGRAAGPVTARPPLEQAARQAKPAAQRASAASLRHQEQLLRAVPPQLLGQPRCDRAQQYGKLRYRSPAADLAIRRMSIEQNATPSAALLAMFAVALARTLRTGTVWTMVLVNNRFRPGLADSVSHLVQSSPHLTELAGMSLAEVIAHTQTGLLQTYKTAYYDGAKRSRLERRVAVDRGMAVDVCCLYNDRGDDRGAPAAPPATDAQIIDALAAAECTTEYEYALPEIPLFLNIDYPPEALDLVLSFDHRYLDQGEAAALAAAIEAAAVQAALTPGVTGWPWPAASEASGSASVPAQRKPIGLL